MTSQNLDDLSRKIAALEEHELVRVLSRVLPAFSPYGDDPQVARSGLFLGAFRRERDTLQIDIVAYPDPQVYGDAPGPDWGLCQRAPSEIDGLDYVSNVKSCLSPFDDRRLHLT